MWIDAHAFSNKYEGSDVAVLFGHYVPGIVSTLGLIMFASLRKAFSGIDLASNSYIIGSMW